MAARRRAGDGGSNAPSGFGRMLSVSAVAHIVAGGALALSPAAFDRTPIGAETVIQVKMVTAAPSKPKGAAPAPRPAPPPPPPPPKEEQIVIPEQVSSIERKPLPKPKPEPKPPQEKREPRSEPEPEFDLGGALDALRDEMGEPEEAPSGEPDTGNTEAVAGASVGRTVSPEVARWVSQVKRRVRGAWVLAPGFLTQSLRTDVEVFLGANGEVKGVDILKRSGNPWYDQSVERALHRASPLPPPPEAGSWPFSFSPEDAR